VPSAALGDLIQTIRAGDIEIAVSSRGGTLRTGTGNLTLAFRSIRTGEPVDVGTVRVTAAMSMPGMTMSSDVVVTPVGTGLYQASGQFGMAGTWSMAMDWNGPAGQGSATFDGTVQ